MTNTLWDQRAELGEKAGTQDLIAKTLEQRELLQMIPKDFDGRTLEIGCGIGETAALVNAVVPRGSLVAIDSAPRMVLKALKANPDIDFRTGDLFDIRGNYDLIYTQRCLINIADQERAFQVIADHLNPGGKYLSIECSQDGLDAINRARAKVGLPEIKPPFAHHRYLLDSELEKVDCLRMLGWSEFSSTYYFLSRVVNAKLAADRGEDPDYDDPINRVALDLPSFGPWSQTRLWIWEKP